MKVIIKSKKTYELKVEPSERVEILKYRIQLEEGIPSSRQKILFKGTRLRDGYRLCDYDIDEGAEFIVIIIILCSIM